MPVSDVIIVGLGAMGSATACQLARRGVDVIGIDRFSPPHAQGSSHGETRITRQAIGEGDHYVPFVLRSHEIWRELEAETGRELFLSCGALVVSPVEGTGLRHGKPDFLAATIAAARRFGILHDELSADEIRRRFPQFLARDHEHGYFEPGGGMVYPERCIAAQQEVARRHGARLQADETVMAIEPVGNGVRVSTDRDVYEAGRVVLAAGAWTPGLAGKALARLQVHRQAQFWFEPEDAEVYDAKNCPVFIWIHGSDVSDMIYGFPVVPGSQGVKVGSESYLSPLTGPDTVDRTVTSQEAAALHQRHIAPRLAGVSAKCLRSAACLYTTTPDGDFVIDHHPDSDRILLLSACSGHGFKHSAAIGESVARTLAGERVGLEVPAFSLARLRSSDPESIEA